MTARCTKAEAQHRTDWMFEQLLAGRPRVQLVRLARQKWGLSESQAQRIAKKAVEQILSTYQSVDHQEAVGKAVYALEVALELALQRKQPNEVVAAVKAMDALVGLGAAHQLRAQGLMR